MSRVMDHLARIAASHGGVDPKNPEAVDDFFQRVGPTLPRQRQQAMLDEALTPTYSQTKSSSVTPTSSFFPAVLRALLSLLSLGRPNKHRNKVAAKTKSR